MGVRHWRQKSQDQRTNGEQSYRGQGSSWTVMPDDDDDDDDGGGGGEFCIYTILGLCIVFQT
jgi:hypothetical protein